MLNTRLRSYYLEASTESGDRFILARNIGSIHHATNMCLEVISNRFFTINQIVIRDSLNHEEVDSCTK